MSISPPLAHLRAPARALAVSLLAGAVRVAGAGALVAFVAALVVTVIGAGALLRGWYALTPGALAHARFGEVFATNLRVCGVALLGAVLVACWPGARRVLDLLLGALLVVNTALVGAALGAYGPALTRPLLAHTVLELVAASIAGAAYLDAGRHRRVHLRSLAGCTMATAGGLALAALVEVAGA